MKSTENQQKRVFIIHGFDAHPCKHWFVWLREQVENLGARAEILAMPNPQMPTLPQWLECIRDNVGVADTNTFFVAHSLGTITTLRYAQMLKKDSQKLGGILLVSGFCAPLPSLPQLDSFTSGELEYGTIISTARSRIIIAAKDDEIVPCELSQNLAQNIEATFVCEPKGGHFMQSDGFDTFELGFYLLRMQLEC